MTRTFFSAALVLVVMGWAVADQPAPTAPRTLPPPQLMVSPTPDKPAELSGRQKIEAILRSPANLDFGDRKSVTIQEVLDQLHEKHQLSIRMDTPTMIWSVIALAASEDSPLAEMVGDAMEAAIEQSTDATANKPAEPAIAKADKPASPPAPASTVSTPVATVSPAVTPSVSPPVPASDHSHSPTSPPSASPAPSPVSVVATAPAEQERSPRPQVAPWQVSVTWWMRFSACPLAFVALISRT